MRSPIAADHVDEVSNDLLGAKEGPIHPSSPLLHQRHHVAGSISKGLGIGHVRQLKLVLCLDIDLETHDSIFCQIFVGLGAGWFLGTCYILEELIERLSFDSGPTENRVGTRQHLSEPKE